MDTQQTRGEKLTCVLDHKLILEVTNWHLKIQREPPHTKVWGINEKTIFPRLQSGVQTPKTKKMDPQQTRGEEVICE